MSKHDESRDCTPVVQPRVRGSAGRPEGCGLGESVQTASLSGMEGFSAKGADVTFERVRWTDGWEETAGAEKAGKELRW